MIGRTLSHFEILDELGRGAMGVVYRARDTKLNRDVAIKVLPEDFAGDEERLARFRREAQLLASLNHPNIAAIYGLEESDGVHYLTLELVPGETLAERLARGRLSVEEALRIARQIVEALEEAHEKSVIHRDLKPANVKLTEDGKVKVLDFGVAKAFSGAAADVDSSQSPTLTRDGTRAGVIMGTAAYMSPEQARGKTVDKRSDIFSFGSVLYEILAGRKAFAGGDVSEILAAVIKTEPDTSALPVDLDPRLRRLLERCLNKDPRERLRDIGDARLEIEDSRTRPDVDAPVSTWRRSLPWALAAMMAIAAFASWRRPSSDGSRTAQLQIVLPPGVLLAVDTEHPVLALSPNGARLVFVGEEDGVRRLYIRDLAESEAQVIAGTEDAASPFFSLDGDWIGFLADESLKKVSVEGGVPVAVHRAVGTVVSRGFTWSTGDTMIKSHINSGVKRASVAGDAMRSFDEWEAITEPTAAYAWPYALPGGKHVLFVDGSQESPDETRIAVLDLETREIETLFRGGTNPRYSPTGHVLFARSGSLYAVSFDPDRPEVTGGERKLLDGLMSATNGAAHFAVGAGGTLAYVTGDAELGDHELVWVDRQGRPETILDRPLFSEPRLSPDGTSLLVTSMTGANIDIWLFNFGRSTFTRLTSHPGEDLAALWSPDGRSLALASEVEEGTDNMGPSLAWMPSFNVAPEVLIQSPGLGNWEGPSSWSPDGKWLAYTSQRGAAQMDIWMLSMEGEAEPVPFLESPAKETAAMFSPDGRWIAYVSDVSGRDEVYVKSFSDPSAPVVQVSARGGFEPLWARNGRELFYREGNKLMVVAFTPGDVLQPKAPEVLFEGRYRKSLLGFQSANYDVSPDGNRFVMVRMKNLVMPTVIHVVLNWPEALMRNRPVKR